MQTVVQEWMLSTHHIEARQPLQQFAVAVFQSMSLIDDCYTPVDFPQLLQIRYDRLICRYQHMETEYIGNGMALTNDSYQNTSCTHPEKRKCTASTSCLLNTAQLSCTNNDTHSYTIHFQRIGSHTLWVKCKNQCAALMTRCAQNGGWYLWTLAFHSWMATQLLPIFWSY